MRVIEIEFHRLVEVTLPDIVRAVGVYVIWDGQARAKPTYIGEGNILKRFGEHSKRFATPFDGYLGILGDTIAATPKREAEMIEALLLTVAYEVDRMPRYNVAHGKTTGIERIFRSHG